MGETLVPLSSKRLDFDSTRSEFRYHADKIYIPAGTPLQRFNMSGARFLMIVGTNKETGGGANTPITVAGELPSIAFNPSGDFFRTRSGDWWLMSPIESVYFKNNLGANDIGIMLIWSNDPNFRMFDSGGFNDRGVAR